MRKIFPLLLALVLPLAACGDDVLGSSTPNFEGDYVYNGTVNGAPNLTLNGRLTITGQQGQTATVLPEITFLQNAQPVGTLRGVAAQNVQLGSDGAISFRVTDRGDIMQHDGRLTGRSITGTWTLIAPEGTLAGSFSAQK